MEKIIALQEEGNIILVFPNRSALDGRTAIFCFSEGHCEAYNDYLQELATVDKTTAEQVINNYLGIYETII